MKTELTDISETQKAVSIEIPTEIVDAEINRVARRYTRQARLPGFRPGKVPQGLIKKRFRDQIFHDVLHDLVPRAVEEALQERGIEPVDTPSIKDVVLEEGRPLTFTAAVETVPPFDPGDLSSLTLRAPSTVVEPDAVDKVLQRLRERAGKYEPVEGRPVTDGDAVVLDLDRTGPDGQVDHHDGVNVQLGAAGNPPGFDANLLGMNVGDSKTFAVEFPETYPAPDLANTTQTYAVTLKDIRRRVLPELDDEFAKDVGAFESLDALRDRVLADLQDEAADNAKQQVRTQLLTQLSSRVTFELPTSLVEREMDRRLEELARQLKAENVDPRNAGIDWGEFREAQREPARGAVASALALDEIARREGIMVAGEDVDKEIERFAVRAGRTPAALRAQLEKEGGIKEPSV
jgi:trigger factor